MADADSPTFTYSDDEFMCVFNHILTNEKIAKHVDNINGNVRDPDVHELMVRPLNSKKTGDGEVFTFDYAPNSLKLPQIWTVDGQTRVKGLALARAMAEAEKA